MLLLGSRLALQNVEGSRHRRWCGLPGKDVLEVTPTLAKAIRSKEQVPSRQSAGDLVVAHSGQPHRSDASALGAVGIAAKLAGSDLRFEVG